MSANIIGIFLRNAAERPDAIAFVEGTGRITYDRLARDVERVAGHLRRRGIGKGDHVLVFVPMSSRLYTLLLALFHVGAVAVFIDAWADRARLAVAARAIELKAFIGVPKAHLLRFLSREIRRIPIKLVASIESWTCAEIHAPAAVEPHDAALVTFTTGSSGTPKGAVRTHGFLVAQHEVLVETFGTAARDVDLPILPIFALNNLASGATTVIASLDPRRVDAFEPSAIVAQIRRDHVATTTGSPSFYRRLAEYCVEKGVGLPSLRRIHLGGAPVGPQLARVLVDAFPETEVTIVYGSTEAEPVSLIDARAMLERVARDDRGLPVGRPIARIDLLIVPIVDGPITVSSEQELRAMALPAGTPGEICVAGDHVLAAYHGSEQAWARTKIRAGERVWHRMGDGGFLDDAGELRLVGSVRQSFERNGERTFVLPVELRLAAIDGVAAGTIMQLDDRVVVAIESAPGHDVAELRRRVRDRGIDHDELRVVDTMPRDPRHRSKIDYTRLREMLGRA